MKKLLFLFLSVLLTSCRIDGPVSSGDVVKTGDAEVSENSVTVYGYLNVDASVRSTCQFGIVYSTDPEPSKDNGVFEASTELDSDNKFAVTPRALYSDTEYYYQAYVRYESGKYQYGKVKSFKTKKVTVTGGSFVDLGLSVKWASCNLGASSPEQYGGYYQWAGIQDVTDKSINLDWSNCPYHTGSDESTGWIKYVPSNVSSYWSGTGSPDNKTVLDLSDDVAYVKLGGNWRMPTNSEWQELRDNCTWAWTTLNGVKGYKVTSNKSGYTNKSIFLPAAGGRNDTYLGNVGSYGYYWSSSLNTYSPNYAYDLAITSSGVGRSNGSRYIGRSVRPVYGDAAVVVTGVSLSKTSMTITEGDSRTLTATISPSNATNKNVTWSSSNTSIATVDASGNVTALKAGTATITAKTADGGKTASCSITVNASSHVAEYVDLGLSVKWASCNLGASSPEQYGGYYQWAGLQDVTDKSIYLEWSNCPYHTGSSSSKGWTKYIPANMPSYWSGMYSPDGWPFLDPEDDVAHVNLGGKWRMPTQAEWKELIDNCTWKWTKYNGVNGFKVTSKMSGYSDKWIFLPAAGYRDNGGIYTAGANLDYWSLSLSNANPSKAICLKDDSVKISDNYRYYGQSVRPVYGDAVVMVHGVKLSKDSLTMAEGDTQTLTAILTPTNATNRNVTWSSSSNVASVDKSGNVTARRAGTATITVGITEGGCLYIAQCIVTVTFSIPEMVDLGLSVKWASCNLGASKPENRGGHYQWGGLQDAWGQDPIFYPSFSKCPYHTGSSSSKGWTKYVHSNESSYWSGSGSPDNKTVLDPEDDVAHVNLGGKWRMPMEAEWKELIDNCTWKWTTQNGVDGYKVTSKKPGYTSKSIFLPALSYCGSDGWSPDGGYYWSSSLHTSDPTCAYCLHFHSSNVDRDGMYRYLGFSVRPVYGDRVIVTGISLNKTSLTMTEGDTQTLTATITPTNASNKSVTWSSSNSAVASVDANGKVTALNAGTATITVTTADGGYTAKCIVTVKAYPVPVPDLVDLGLSVKWATCNLGASKAEDYGGYYQWAGLQDVTSTSIYLDWSNCPYYTGSSSSTSWTKYIPSAKSSYWSGSGSPDNKTVLDPEDDVAHVKLGGKWRIPTDAEWTELIDSCTWIWTTQNGVKGYKVTSKKNGNSIFLPAAGFRRYGGSLDNVGSDGGFWSSSLRTDYPDYAYGLRFDSGYVYTNFSYYRCYGLSVRPVSE